MTGGLVSPIDIPNAQSPTAHRPAMRHTSIECLDEMWRGELRFVVVEKTLKSIQKASASR
jgi:hypothetical protein